MNPKSLPQCISDFFDRLGLDKGTGIVAVSGGPDSVAVFRLLLRLQADGRVGRLIVAHVNHQLRGAESDADEAFVESLARRRPKVSVASIRLDTKAFAKSAGDNLENCARQIRYEYFTGIAQIEKATWVATGHTADDQAETVLHRLIRGTGLQGLCGIPESRELAPGIRVVRPLLTTRRTEVLGFLKKIKQRYRTDSSNKDFRFTRNRIRHELLPRLAGDYSPGIVDTLCQLAQQATEENNRHRAVAAELLHKAELPRAGSMLVFQKLALAAATRNQVREVLRLVWERERWPQGDMTFEAWDRLASLVDVESGAVDLPGGIRARCKGGVIQLVSSELC